MKREHARDGEIRGEIGVDESAGMESGPNKSKNQIQRHLNEKVKNAQHNKIQKSFFSLNIRKRLQLKLEQLFLILLKTKICSCFTHNIKNTK
jgi:hypothetical protein